MLLVPLAVTSTDRLDAAARPPLAALHRLVYLSTALGVLHFLLAGQGGLARTGLYIAIYVALMVWRWRKRPGARTASSPARPSA